MLEGQRARRVSQKGDALPLKGEQPPSHLSLLSASLIKRKKKSKRREKGRIPQLTLLRGN
jgi:hypothetical protein